MRNDSFTYKYYVSKNKKNPKGEYPIFLRIIVNRKKPEIFTRLAIKDLQDWDETTQRIRAKTTANSILSRIEAEITKIYNHLKFSNQPVTAAIIKDKFLGRNNIVEEFKKYIEVFFNERIMGNPEIAETTKKITKQLSITSTLFLKHAKGKIFY